MVQKQDVQQLQHEIDKKHREEEEAPKQAVHGNGLEAMNSVESIISTSLLGSESPNLRGEKMSNTTDETLRRRRSTFARMKRRMRRRKKIIDPDHHLTRFFKTLDWRTVKDWVNGLRLLYTLLAAVML